MSADLPDPGIQDGDVGDGSPVAPRPAELQETADIIEQGAARALFDGDRGRLPLLARRALVLLLKSTYLSGHTHPAEWQAFLADEPAATATLNELFLVPVIDEDAKVAYKVQAAAEDSEMFNTLLTDRALRATEVRVLLHLRRLLAETRARGDAHTHVTGAELLDRLAEHYPEAQGDHITARRNDAAQLKALVRDGVLIPPLGQADAEPDQVSYEVAPIVEAMVTPERIAAFTAALASQTPDADRTRPAAAPAGVLADELTFEGPGER